MKKIVKVVCHYIGVKVASWPVFMPNRTSFFVSVVVFRLVVVRSIFESKSEKHTFVDGIDHIFAMLAMSYRKTI